MVRRQDEGRRLVVALGGNALLRAGQQGTLAEQQENAHAMAREIAALAAAGWNLVLVPGNGPQVGNLALQQEAPGTGAPSLPLDVCGAMSQGEIGYILQLALHREFARRRLSRQLVTVLTHCLVDAADPAFAVPSKPVGPFYDETTAARLRAERGWTVVLDAGRGYRRVVPSPAQLGLLEVDAVRTLLESGSVVVAATGGGVPVVAAGDGYRGVEAVVDKDLAAALLARSLGAQVLLMLTAVTNVYLDYGRPHQRPLGLLHAAEAAEFLAAGQFAAGSMGPKVQAALDFLAAGGELAVITSTGLARAALAGRAGTRLRRDEPRRLERSA